MTPKATKSIGTETISHKKFDFVLALIVFLSGGCLMALELVGSRLIAPTYGSSIYTWGSLLGIFMLALSVGYYFGGKIADMFPSYATLAIILALSGLGVIFIPFVTLGVCEMFVGLQQKWGSFFSCLVLFAPSSILMGMVSPLAIRLLAEDIEKVGKVAGSLYALSTVGSIVGTFATSFVLITHFGMFALTRGIGAALIITSFIALARLLAKRGRAAVTTAIVLFLFGMGGIVPAYALKLPYTIHSEGINILATEDSPYNTLYVIDRGNERTLQFNDRQESGFYLDRPNQSSFTYTVSMHAVFALNRDIKKILLIGGGGAVLPIEFVCAYENVTFDSVEIDPGVIEYSKKYFVDYAADYFSNPENQVGTSSKKWANLIRNNINLIEEDGRMFVRRPEAKGKYDLVIMDAYLGGRIPFHLTTREFFDEVQSCLKPDGLMAMNIISAFRGEKGLVFRSLYRTISQFFPGILIAPPLGSHVDYASTPDDIAIQSTTVKNVILIASRSENISGAKTREILNRMIASSFFPHHISLKMGAMRRSIGTVAEYEQQEKEIIESWAKRTGNPAPVLVPLIDKDRDIVLTDSFTPVDIWSGLTMLQ